jgi:RNA polymerase sigma factor (sigma-70 family)
MILYSILILNLLLLVNSYYLTNNQKISIKYILSSDEISQSQKNMLKQKIVSKYTNWAIKEAREFQKTYKISPNYIRSSELIQAALLGLTKSMKNYDGRVNVNHYSKYYIKGELFKCLTTRLPFGYYKHHYIMNKKIKPSESKQITNIKTDQIKKEDEPINNNEEILNEVLLKISNFDKRIFLLRYDVYSLKKKNSIKKIGELMCVSHETIRKSIKKTKKKILDNNINEWN